MIFLLFFIFISSISYSQDTIINRIVGTPTRYTIKPGDKLFDLAKKFNTSTRHIKLANVLLGKDIVIGEEIIIPSHHIVPQNIEQGILINIPELLLYYFEEREIKYIFPVTVGKYSFPTPVGKFTVIYKVKNPTWIPPKWAGIEKPVLPGPHNPLGDRWIQLSRMGYGIHSTNAPSSIGMPVSHGCIRMYPWDVEILYNMISVGTPVYIIYERIKIGYSLGKFYLEVHPDIYRREPEEKVLEKLEKSELFSLTNAKQIKEIIREARGIPVSISGVDIYLSLSGERQRIILEVIDNELWADISSFISALGGEVDFLEEKNSLEIFYEGIIIQINLQTREIVYSGYRWGGLNIKRVLNYNLAPLADLTKMFGYQLSVDWQKKEVHIY